ncbi:MAG: hypothetical protein IGS39_22685 [Calothrix sp. C42_A2020_038]|nr:hypothetical protein [Calothrix sp. C42_A2020_038]
MVSQVSEATASKEMVITWEALPDDFRLEDEPGQPLLAAALSEVLELLGTEGVEQEHQRAEQERQQKERLAEYLKSQGIDRDNLPK